MEGQVPAEPKIKSKGFPKFSFDLTNRTSNLASDMSLKETLIEQRHRVFYVSSYFLWFLSHTLLVCVTAGESWVILNNPDGSSISDTSPFSHRDTGYGQAGTAALLTISVLISSFGLLADKFITTKKFGRALPSVISIGLIVTGLLILTGMSLYTSSYDVDGIVWGWSYSLGWAIVWLYFICGVGYYFGYDPDE